MSRKNAPPARTAAEQLASIEVPLCPEGNGSSQPQLLGIVKPGLLEDRREGAVGILAGGFEAVE